MKIYKFYQVLLLSISICAGSFDVKAQQDSVKGSDHGISLLFQPLFISINAIKLDLEVQKPQGRFAYILSPEFYSGITKDDHSNGNHAYSDDRISGFGIGIHQKYKFKKEPVSHYFAYGLTYRYNKINYDTEGFMPYQENGLTYYGYAPYNRDLKINSMLVSAVLGFQESYWDTLLLDLYLGFGYKIPDVKTDTQEARHYGKYFMSPAYEGILLTAGIKIGVRIKK